MQQGYLNFQQDYVKIPAMPFKIEHVPMGPRKQGFNDIEQFK